MHRNTKTSECWKIYKVAHSVAQEFSYRHSLTDVGFRPLSIHFKAPNGQVSVSESFEMILTSRKRCRRVVSECVGAGEAVSPESNHVPCTGGDAVAMDDGMFAPLAGNGSKGRVVFSTQESNQAVQPEQHTSSSQKKWCLIDIWQRPL